MQTNIDNAIEALKDLDGLNTIVDSSARRGSSNMGIER